MDFEPTEKVLELRARVDAFMDEHIFPRELEHGDWVEDSANQWTYPPWFEDLKAKARDAGIWNWFLPKEYEDWSPGLSNLEFAPLMERICRVPWAQEVFNCSAPDRGNMEVLARFGNAEQQERWLKPLLAGEIRSAFSMTEPAVASSDASNLETSIVRDGDESGALEVAQASAGCAGLARHVRGARAPSGSDEVVQAFGQGRRPPDGVFRFAGAAAAGMQQDAGG